MPCFSGWARLSLRSKRRYYCSSLRIACGAELACARTEVAAWVRICGSRAVAAGFLAGSMCRRRRRRCSQDRDNSGGLPLDEQCWF